MNHLHKKHCLPCEGIGARLSQDQIKKNLKQLKGWKVQRDTLHKEFKFETFASALKFVNRVGAIAESEAHHPDIEFGWGYACLSLKTHSLGGLSMNDFILAAKIDKVVL